MSLIRDLSKEYKTISIVGMSKNAGKTTALNFLIEEAYDEGLRLGITSTGRDGETVDLVTETEKPKVYLYEDTIVSVPRQLYDLAEAGLEILSMSKYRTSLGELLLTRVKDAGFVQIAGPVAVADTKKMCAEMEALGAELILIDGAIDRKSVAMPEASDAVILATGAVLSRDMEKVVKETAHVVDLYSLPELEAGPIRTIIEEHIGESETSSEEGVLIIKSEEGGDSRNFDDYSVETLDIKTGLGSGRYISEAIDDNTVAVYIPGALTQNMIENIDPAKLSRADFILKDPTRIFIDHLTHRKLLKRGTTLKVLDNIKVSAITVNPISVEGYKFDSQVLREALEKAIPNIPIIDVMQKK